jgi:hypothetical protein
MYPVQPKCVSDYHEVHPSFHHDKRSLGLQNSTASLMGSTDDRGHEIRAVAATMYAIAAAALLLRCYVRLRIVKAFGMDDFFMVFAMVRDDATVDRLGHLEC